MSTARVGGELMLSGPPRSVRAIVPISAPRSAVVPVAITIDGRVSIVRAVLRPLATDTSELRLRLPDQIAPGVYRGEMTLEGKPRAVLVEIQAQRLIRLQPEQSLLSVGAGSREPFSVTVINGGNVAIDIPTATGFDLDDAEGQERALGRSLRATLTPGEPRVDRFFEELRESHGGEARVTIRSGAGPLPPGETRTIACVLNVPEDIRAGRTYTGFLEIGSESHLIVADIISSSRPLNARAAQ